MTDTGRYAIYFLPGADGALADRGGRWLGYDAVTGAAYVPPQIDGLSQQRWAEITRAPRRYGFHATLKPPFRLADGCSADALATMARTLAGGLQRVTVPRLAVGTVGDFIALVPDGDLPELSAIAAACVRALDAFRAPNEGAALDRFASGALSARQRALAAEWGYPYLLDEYRFHMTLTGPLPAEQRDETAALLREWFAPVLETPLPVDAISLLYQPDSAAPFRVRARYPLAA